MGVEPVRTSFRSPGQNGVAERFIGTVRRELLDYVIVLGEGHRRTLLEEFIGYYHEDRTHLGIAKELRVAATSRAGPPSRQRSSPCLASAASTVATPGATPRSSPRG
jgi:transposase InsO family protein